MRNDKGLYIGRFQPFHLGHLSAIKQALRQVDFLTIGIGSSQYSKEKKNPYTAEEREEMIELSLKEAEIPSSNYRIIEIPDIHNDEKWPAHVRKITGDFDMIFLGNDGIVNKLFVQYEDTPVIRVNHEIEISATEIRKMMESEENWGKFVPKSVAKFLKKSL